MSKYTMSTKFFFGKHKGKTLSEVLSLEPSYIGWCIEHIPNFFLADSAIEYMNECLPVNKFGALAAQKWEKFLDSIPPDLRAQCLAAIEKHKIEQLKRNLKP